MEFSRAVRNNRVAVMSIGMLSAVALMAVSVNAGAQEPVALAAEPVVIGSTEHIIVTETLDGEEEAEEAAEDEAVALELEPVQECITADDLTRTVDNTEDNFVLTIQIPGQLCAPVEASAVIYQMPGGGVAWPQTLLEKVPFTLQMPGTVEVLFIKDCFPAQFDVITGATPQVIAPWLIDQYHGPLLFPGDLATALQFWGKANCEPTTSSTSSTTTSTTTTTSEPDVPVTVLGVTTTIVGGTPPPAVGGNTATNTSTAANSAALSVAG